MSSHLILVGYRGSGKSTVGRLLAARLGREFLDADAVLEAQAGRTIREIFSTEGELGFRDRESAVLAELCSREPAVIATGGGVILREANRDLLRAHGFTVWLTADAETLWQRITADSLTAERRPALSVGGLEEVRQLVAARQPHYRSVADATVDVGAISPERAAEAIFVAWETRSTCKSPTPSG